MTSEPDAADAYEPPAHPSVPTEDLYQSQAELPQFPSPSTDPRAVADRIRDTSSVALSSSGAAVLLRHADVVAAAHQPEVFSSGVSRYLQLPNGLDGEEHTAYRSLIDRYLTDERVAAVAPAFREEAAALCAELAQAPEEQVLDAVSDIGAVFAVRAQVRWLGWPRSLEPQLLQWVQDNWAATRSGRQEATAEVARRFDQIIESVLAPRRQAGEHAPEDVTTELMGDTFLGRRLTEVELVSILRNWTGGDLGSIALCVGVIVHYLAVNPQVQDRVRSGASEVELAAIIDEILRIDDPFVANRRITTCPVAVDGVQLPAGHPVVLNWTSANRDEQQFGNPEDFDPEANAPSNLVYGTGTHVCPGRTLATVELRVLIEELVAAFSHVGLAPGAEPQRQCTPVGGFAAVPVVLTPRNG